MKIRYVLSLVLTLLAFAPALHAADAPAVPEASLEAAAPAEARITADGGLCADAETLSVASLEADPVAAMFEQDCPGGFPVSSCTECQGCFCQQVLLCCYCS